MPSTHGLRAITLATLVALAGLSALSTSVAATDPTPAPSPVATASASPASTPVPTPTATSMTTATSAVTTATAVPSLAIVPSSAASVSVPVAAATPAPAAKPNPGAVVARIALAQRHKRYVFGASGPSAFDCSGLVLYAYRRAGLARSLGGGHSAYGMYRWARAHGLTSRSHPRVGDLVIYGGGTHVAIYIGNGRVVSALNRRQGIRVTGLHALRRSFTAFIHPRF